MHLCARVPRTVQSFLNCIFQKSEPHIFLEDPKLADRTVVDSADALWLLLVLPVCCVTDHLVRREFAPLIRNWASHATKNVSNVSYLQPHSYALLQRLRNPPSFFFLSEVWYLSFLPLVFPRSIRWIDPQHFKPRLIWFAKLCLYGWF